MEVYAVKTHREDGSGTCISKVVAVCKEYEKADNIALAYFKEEEDKWAEDYDSDSYKATYDKDNMSLYGYDWSEFFNVTITKLELE